jgi:hypothetical protein
MLAIKPQLTQLRVDESMGTWLDTAPFQLGNAQLWIGSSWCQAANVPLADLTHITLVMCMHLQISGDFVLSCVDADFDQRVCQDRQWQCCATADHGNELC